MHFKKTLQVSFCHLNFYDPIQKLAVDIWVAFDFEKSAEFENYILLPIFEELNYIIDPTQHPDGINNVQTEDERIRKTLWVQNYIVWKSDCSPGDKKI